MIHLNKLTYALILVAVLCVGILYYTWEKTQDSAGIQPAAPATNWIEVAGAAGVLNLEIVPFQEPTSIYKDWKYLRDYLSQKTGMKVNLKVSADYRSAINDVGLGVADLALLSPALYVEARKDYCVNPLAAPSTPGGLAKDRCLLIAREDSGINSVLDIKGKSFAFGDEKSMCGTLIAHKWMADNNITYPAELKMSKYFPNYNAVVQALVSGGFEAGAVKESVYNQIKPSGIKIVATSEEVEGLVLVSTFDLEKPIVEQIIKALTEMDASEAKKVDPRYSGWAQTNDDIYAGLRDTIKNVHGLDYTIAKDFCLIKPKCKLAAK